MCDYARVINFCIIIIIIITFRLHVMGLKAVSFLREVLYTQLIDAVDGVCYRVISVAPSAAIIHFPRLHCTMYTHNMATHAVNINSTDAVVTQSIHLNVSLTQPIGYTYLHVVGLTTPEGTRVAELIRPVAIRLRYDMI